MFGEPDLAHRLLVSSLIKDTRVPTCSATEPSENAAVAAAWVSFYAVRNSRAAEGGLQTSSVATWGLYWGRWDDQQWLLLHIPRVASLE